MCEAGGFTVGLVRRKDRHFLRCEVTRPPGPGPVNAGVSATERQPPLWSRRLVRRWLPDCS
jgi:hypothetical protein